MIKAVSELQAFGAGKAGQKALHSKTCPQFPHSVRPCVLECARCSAVFDSCYGAWDPRGIGFYKLGAATALLLEQLRGTAFQQGDILAGVLMF
jgi:hypothetical protein